MTELRGILTINEDTKVKRLLAEILHAGKKNPGLIFSTERPFIKRAMFLLRRFTKREAGTIYSIYGRIKKNPEYRLKGSVE